MGRPTRELVVADEPCRLLCQERDIIVAYSGTQPGTEPARVDQATGRPASVVGGNGGEQRALGLGSRGSGLPARTLQRFGTDRHRLVALPLPSCRRRVHLGILSGSPGRVASLRLELDSGLVILHPLAQVVGTPSGLNRLALQARIVTSRSSLSFSSCLSSSQWDRALGVDCDDATATPTAPVTASSQWGRALSADCDIPQAQTGGYSHAQVSMGPRLKRGL